MSSPPDLYDSHCHLDDPELAPELGEAFALAREKGLCGAVIPGYGPERWERQTELVRGDFDFRMLGGFGIHPWAVDGSLTIAELEAVLEQGWQQHARGWEKRLVAVGEFGLDRSSRGRDVPFELQRELFALHQGWAERLELPLILHLVRADGAAFELLQARPPVRGGVIHAFASHAQTVPRYAELDLSFSFGSGLLTLEKARQALKAAPLERVLFETDGPQPLKGEFSRPWGPHHLIRIVEAASQVLGKSVEYLLSRHRENCGRIFGLGPESVQGD